VRPWRNSSAGWAPDTPSVPAVDDEERDAADAERAGLGLVAADGLGVAVAGQDVADLGLVEADLDGERGELVVVGDGEALRERAAVEALLERVLAAVGLRQVQQAVGVEAVAAAVQVEPEVQALTRGHARDPVEHRVDLRGGPAEPGLQLLGVRAAQLRRRLRRRVQLERLPLDVDLTGVREPCQRGLEPSPR
jgi:hypothetical protein